jgi:DNA-binding transcriptional ArsR family regulator
MSNLSSAFEVLADPTRLRIVEELRRGERSVGSIVSTLGVCQPGVSRHLRILHEAGFVHAHPDGQRRLYSLRRERFRDLDAWIREYRDLVESRLDRLDQLVEATRGTYHPVTKFPRRN